jgi:hypothetical protein
MGGRLAGSRERAPGSYGVAKAGIVGALHNVRSTAFAWATS